MLRRRSQHGKQQEARCVCQHHRTARRPLIDFFTTLPNRFSASVGAALDSSLPKSSCILPKAPAILRHGLHANLLGEAQHLLAVGKRPDLSKPINYRYFSVFCHAVLFYMPKKPILKSLESTMLPTGLSMPAFRPPQFGMALVEQNPQEAYRLLKGYIDEYNEAQASARVPEGGKPVEWLLARFEATLTTQEAYEAIKLLTGENFSISEVLWANTSEGLIPIAVVAALRGKDKVVIATGEDAEQIVSQARKKGVEAPELLLKINEKKKNSNSKRIKPVWKFWA